MARGKLIVIDGTDGSGKATQAKLLVKRLQKMGRKVAVIDFPRYGYKSAGAAEDYLNGRYGTTKGLGAYIPSIFFAVDRFAASKDLKQRLAKGFIIVSNRYVTANMAHQGGKIKNNKERNKYFKWLSELEYGLFGIPKPDLNIILHLPPKISQKLLKARGPKYYTGAKKIDLHEQDLSHLAAAEQCYLSIAKQFRMPVVEGFENNELLTPLEVNEKIFKIAKKVL